MAHRKLNRFLHRQKQLLTVIGALIVFLTFIVNEVLRERLRDVATSITSAQNLLAIHDDIRGTRHQLQSILVMLNSKHPQSEKTRVASYYLFMSEKFGFLNDAVRNGSTNLDRLSPLIRAIPDNGRIEVEVKSLKQEGQTLSKKVNEIWANIYPPPPASDPGFVITRSLTELEEFNKHLDECFEPIGNWTIKANRMVGEILTKAEQTRDQAERNYKIYTRASYFLYTLGWILALIGKLGSVDEALGHE